MLCNLNIVFIHAVGDSLLMLDRANDVGHINLVILVVSLQVGQHRKLLM